MAGQKREYTNTGAKNSKGRTVYRGAQGGMFVLLDSGKKRYVDPARYPAAAGAAARSNAAPAGPAAAAARPSNGKRLAQNFASRTLLAQAVARNAAVSYAKARSAKGPRGMGSAGELYVKNANGYVTDPVSLNRIPKRRAVKVGPHTYNAKTLRALFRANPRATNPLTRQPFPPEVYAKYGHRAEYIQRHITQAVGAYQRMNAQNARNAQNDENARITTRQLGAGHLVGDQAKVWRAALALVSAYGRTRASSITRLPASDLARIQNRFGVRIQNVSHDGRQLMALFAPGNRVRSEVEVVNERLIFVGDYEETWIWVYDTAVHPHNPVFEVEMLEPDDDEENNYGYYGG